MANRFSVEGSTIIIAACIPTLRPLFNRIMETTISVSSEGSSRHKYSAREHPTAGALFTFGGTPRDISLRPVVGKPDLGDPFVREESTENMISPR